MRGEPAEEAPAAAVDLCSLAMGIFAWFVLVCPATVQTGPSAEEASASAMPEGAEGAKSQLRHAGAKSQGAKSQGAKSKSKSASAAEDA